MNQGHLITFWLDLDPGHRSSVGGAFGAFLLEPVRLCFSSSCPGPAGVRHRTDSLRRVCRSKRRPRISYFFLRLPWRAAIDELREWIEPDDEAYFRRALRKLHSERFVELNEGANLVRLLPPGAKSVATLLRSTLLK